MKAKAVSVISGADGPTTVFLLGAQKEKNLYRRWKNYTRQRKYRKRYEKVRKAVTASPHTLTEVVGYIKEKYGAVECGEAEARFRERKGSLKAGLIQQKAPELLGTPLHSFMPENLREASGEEVRQWMEKVEEYQKKAELLPDEIFPMDYHLYVIDWGTVVHIEVDVDFLHEELSCSGSGDGDDKDNTLHEILKDIYLYYGVMQKDIDEESYRYKHLITTLASI